MEDTIVVLANSVKFHEHCVAGKSINSKKWIRPVADNQGGELNNQQVTYENKYGRFQVKTLQKIKMGFVSRAPLPHQPDNFLIDGNIWQQKYSISENELIEYLDHPNDLWGQGDRVNYQNIENGNYQIEQSLYLVKIDDLRLYSNMYEDKKRRRASFTYKDNNYDLAVTDPKFDTIVSEEQAVQGILCISLAKPLNNNCFKLVATIF